MERKWRWNRSYLAQRVEAYIIERTMEKGEGSIVPLRRLLSWRSVILNGGGQVGSHVVVGQALGLGKHYPKETTLYPKGLHKLRQRNVVAGEEEPQA